MPIKYTKEECLNNFKREFNKNLNIYCIGLINNHGFTKDTNEKYTEIFADHILDNLDIFKSSNTPVTRKKTYKTISHVGKINNECNTNEDVFGKTLYQKHLDNVGEIIDYQIPIKDKKRSSSTTGKIDLLSYNHQKNNLYLLELKIPHDNITNDETLLRSVLEIYTYSKQINQKKFLADFNLSKASSIPSVFPVEGCRAFNEYNDGTSINVKKLMKVLDIDFNYLNREIFDTFKSL